MFFGRREDLAAREYTPRMKLKPDLHECEHDLDGDREPLHLVDGRVGLYCRKCDSYVVKGTTSTGTPSGVDEIAKKSEKTPDEK
jgi:hypothetical protein